MRFSVFVYQFTPTRVTTRYTLGRNKPVFFIVVYVGHSMGYTRRVVDVVYFGNRSISFTITTINGKIFGATYFAGSQRHTMTRDRRLQGTTQFTLTQRRRRVHTNVGLSYRVKRGTGTRTRFVKVFVIRFPRVTFVLPFTKTRRGVLGVLFPGTLFGRFTRGIGALITGGPYCCTSGQDVEPGNGPRRLLGLLFVGHFYKGVIYIVVFPGQFVNFKVMTCNICSIWGSTGLPQALVRGQIGTMKVPQVGGFFYVYK